MTDSRIKVRRQSHSCVRDTLLNLQGNAALAPASEAITKSVDSLEILCITLKEQLLRNANNRRLIDNIAWLTKEIEIELTICLSKVVIPLEMKRMAERKKTCINFLTWLLEAWLLKVLMISAAMKGMARLAYEFSDLVSIAYKLLPSTFLLLQRKNREIIKANLGFLKVLVAKSQAEGLQMFLGSMVEGLLRWQDDTINHFKAKVKHILEMLVKKCGVDAVKAVMPEEHMKLLANIRKIKERRERKHAASSEETKSHMSRATTSRISRWDHTKIFSDFSDGETENSDGECR
ncbi:hypothetical protein OIU78_002676 [Salix suchowensis]|nr:hypothetical protein OIU78_002676 [Salix suchowensis]